jgi:hypothetical protein
VSTCPLGLWFSGLHLELSSGPQQFATISDATSADQPREIVAPGLPISMHNFLVTPKDCGLAAQNNPVDSDLQALAHYVAMSTVYSRQKRDTQQQQRHMRRAAAFSSTGFETRHVRRRYNSNPTSDSNVSGTVVNRGFGGFNHVFSDTYIDLDKDETMSAPEPSTSSAERSVSIPAPGTEFEDGLDALALANASHFPEPRLVNDDLLSPPVPLDFSALGTEEPVDRPSA